MNISTATTPYLPDRGVWQGFFQTMSLTFCAGRYVESLTCLDSIEGPTIDPGQAFAI